MKVFPFSLSYLILTPRRVRLPSERPPPIPAATLPSSSSRWPTRFLTKARSFRSNRPATHFPTMPNHARGMTIATGAPADELGYTVVGSPTTADETTELLYGAVIDHEHDYDHDIRTSVNSDPTLIDIPTSPTSPGIVIL